MNHEKHFPSSALGLHHALTHIVITLLAVGIAFSLPQLATYILYNWWPMVEGDSRLQMMTEIGFAVVLVLLFNISKFAWDGRRSMHMNKIASLVHARDGGGWISRLQRRNIHKKLACARDVYILSITGHDTFGAENRELQEALQKAYEIRVMLANPYADGVVGRVQSLGKPELLLQEYRQETEASIAFLRKLAAAGKKIELKLYDGVPFWKLVVIGEYVWVQHYHDGHEVKTQPEYVFGLQHASPERGFFAPFYKYFLDQWNDPRHPGFNFETNELVYRNLDGNEIGRVAFPPGMRPVMAQPDLAPVTA